MPDAPSQGWLNEMKRYQLDLCGEMVEWNLKQEETRETPRKPYLVSFHPPQNAHEETEMQTRDPSGERERITACATDIL